MLCVLSPMLNGRVLILIIYEVVLRMVYSGRTMMETMSLRHTRESDTFGTNFLGVRTL